MVVPLGNGDSPVVIHAFREDVHETVHRFLFLVFAVSVILFVQFAANIALAADPLLGDWHNQADKPSTLTIGSLDAETGMLRGIYRDGTTGTEGPVVGWVVDPTPGKGDNVKVLSFTVQWSKLAASRAGLATSETTPKRLCQLCTCNGISRGAIQTTTGITSSPIRIGLPKNESLPV